MVLRYKRRQLNKVLKHVTTLMKLTIFILEQCTEAERLEDFILQKLLQ